VRTVRQITGREEKMATHQVEVLIEVEADDRDDARHTVLGIDENAIGKIKVVEVRDLPLRDDDITTDEFILTPAELSRMWDISPAYDGR
jgi:hypothetical protein